MIERHGKINDPHYIGYPMMIENYKGYEIIKDIDLGNPMGVNVYVFYPPGGF